MKTKQKWLILFALVAVLALALTLTVACDGNGNDDDDNSSGEYIEFDGFAYRLNDDGETYKFVEVLDKTIASVTVPATVDGKSVTSIGGYAFDSAPNVKEVTVSEGIVKLEEGAFASSKVTTVVLPNSLEVIGSSAFANCNSLTSVTIGSGVKSVGYGAFGYCTSLTSVALGDSVETLDYNIFEGCAKLERLELPFLGKSLGGETYSLWRLFAGELGVPSTLKTVKIHSGVIGSNAFIQCPDTLTNIVLGEKVSEISENAFSLSSGLVEIVVPNSVTKIGASAFSWCKKLEKVELGNGIDKIEDSLFEGCEALTDVIIPNSVKSIGNSAFHVCQKLTTLEIPSGVTSIGSYAFRECFALKSINLPDTLTVIAEGLFQSCRSLTDIEIPTGVTAIDDYAFAGCASLAKVEIPNAVKTIGQNAFSQCSGLKEISFGSGVETIGEDALGCKPSKVSYAGDVEGWLAIDSKANFDIDSGYDFYLGGELVVDLVIPDTVTQIRDFAFDSCGSLETLTVGSNVESFGYASFFRCRNLQKLYWNATACQSAEFAFDNYSKIYYVELGENVTSLPDRAFVGCGRIAEVFNKSQLDISSHVYDKSHIADSVYNIYTPTEGSSQLITTQSGFVFCKTSSYATCVLVTYLGNETEITLPQSPWSGYKYEVGNYAFYGNDTISKITLSSDVREIGQRSFANCANLTELVIPVGLSSIGYCGVDSENLTIRFLGTMEQWRSVYKSPAYCAPKVICSDGTCEFTEQSTQD